MKKFVLKNGETRFQKAETRFQKAETRFQNAKTAFSRIFFARTWMDSAQKKAWEVPLSYDHNWINLIFRLWVCCCTSCCSSATWKREPLCSGGTWRPLRTVPRWKGMMTWRTRAGGGPHWRIRATGVSSSQTPPRPRPHPGERPSPSTCPRTGETGYQYRRQCWITNRQYHPYWIKKTSPLATTLNSQGTTAGYQ